MAWPDIVIAIVLAFGIVSGFRRGLIGELTGIVAIGGAIVAAFDYGGFLDAWVRGRTQLSGGTAHVAGLLLFAAIVYAAILLAGGMLSRIAKLPVIGIANAAGGAAIGCAKALLFVWIALYVALFFPLPSDLREQLHRSVLIALIEKPNEALDAHMRDSLPAFVRPASDSLFGRHRV